MAQRMQLVKELERWRRLEDKDSEDFTSMSFEIGDVFLKALYKRISHDSLRHLAILTTTVNMLKAGQIPKVRVPDHHVEKIKRHLAGERKALKFAESITKRISNGYARIMLEEILSDEKQHHRLLAQMIRDSRNMERNEKVGVRI